MKSNSSIIQFLFIQIKLSDLGFELKPQIAWMSPELIHFNHYTTSSDVFSFGVSMWECFSYGQIPWKDLTNDQVR